MKADKRGAKLTVHNAVSTKGEVLTRQTTRPFVVCFEDRLHKGFNFTDLSQSDCKSFQRFLDKVAGMTFADVDKLFLRIKDGNDKHMGMQVAHYEVSQKFRIHGVIKGDRFCVIRLDPNHKVHGG